MEWISVKDRLPDDEENVLAFVFGEAEVCCLKNGVWRNEWMKFYDGDITHWMPLPEPPKEEN